MAGWQTHKTCCSRVASTAISTARLTMNIFDNSLSRCIVFTTTTKYSHNSPVERSCIWCEGRDRDRQGDRKREGETDRQTETVTETQRETERE